MASPASVNGRIFISYSRDDDEAFVARLRRDLTRRRIPVWWDRKSMESRGRTFLQEIRDAIAVECERLVLVVGPGAARSDYVVYEWKHALEHCKIVIPVLRKADESAIPADLRNAGYNLIPAELARFHAPSFLIHDGADEEARERVYSQGLADLVRILRKRPPAPGDVSSVEWTSSHFVTRPEYMERLKALVLRDVTAPTVITSALQTTALYGMGGIGKSVLAAAFARACFTRRSFEHGVLWLKFGRQSAREPDLTLANLRRAAQWLGDFESARYLDRETARDQLATIMTDRCCLLVLDDVWDLAQAAPFVHATTGTRSRVLVTTRDASLVRSLEAASCPVDVLDPRAASELLAAWSGTARDQLPAVAVEIIDECGHLPLAIAMIGAMVAGRPADRWQDALERLRHADLDRIRHDFPQYRDKPNLLAAMQVSVDALGLETRERYFDFAVFPEDALVPEAVLVTLWRPLGMSEAIVHDSIDSLVDRSLLRRDQHGLLSLHDLQHDYLQREAGDVQAIRKRLLESYRSRCPDDWPSGPADGYFHQHLVEQLLLAGEEEEVHRLLALDAADGRNAWYGANEPLGNIDGYMQDLDRARQLVTRTCADEVRRSGAAHSVALQVHYALMQSSLAALSGSVPAKVLVALHEKRVMSPGRALDSAKSMPHQSAAQLYRKLGALSRLGASLPAPFDRLASDTGLDLVAQVQAEGALEAERIATPFAGLIRTLPSPLLARAAAVAEAFHDSDIREQLYIPLATRHIALDERAQAFATAARIRSETWRAQCLRIMSPLLGIQDMPAARQLMAGITADSERGPAAGALALRLAALGRFDEALVETLGIAELPALWDALFEIAPHFDAGIADAALTFAREREAPYSSRRACAMARLAERLPEPLRSETIRMLHDEARRRYDKEGEYAQRDLIGFLPLDALETWDRRFAFMRKEELRGAAAARFAELGAGAKALEIARELAGPQRAGAIEKMIPFVTEDVIDDLREIVESERDPHWREVSLTYVLPRIAELGRSAEALSGALAMTNGMWQRQTLERMAPSLEAAELLIAAQRLARIDDSAERQAALAALAPFAEAERGNGCLQAVSGGIDPLRLERLLHFLAPSEAERERARGALARQTPSLAREMSLLVLCPQPAATQVRAALDAAYGSEEQETPEVLWVLQRTARLIPELPGHERAPLNASARALAWDRFHALAEFADDAMLAEWLVTLAHLDTPEAALEAVHELKQKGKVAGTRRRFPQHLALLAAVEPHLRSPQREEVLNEVLREIEDATNPYDPLIALGAVADLLSARPIQSLSRLLDGKCEVKHARTETAAVALRLAQLGARAEALALVRRLPHGSMELRARALTGIAAAGPPEPALLEEAIDAVVRVSNSAGGVGRAPPARARILEELAEVLIRLEPSALLPMWGKLLSALARYPRPEFVADLGTLGPVIAHIGGPSAGGRVRESVATVARWWP
jgi:hypothetical protein